jgi:hypothetical protein
MVWDVFQLAKENAPAIIFMDEIDAIATAGFDAQTGADREVQRILMELLNQVPPPTFTLHMSMYRSSWQDAKYPPLSSVRHPTVQPCGESHCSAARFSFFSSFVFCCYTSTKKYYFYSVQKGMPVVGPDSLREKV